MPASPKSFPSPKTVSTPFNMLAAAEFDSLSRYQVCPPIRLFGFPEAGQH